MGRRKQTDIQTFRTKIFHEMLVRNTNLSQAKMDMLFRHPNKVSMDYKERRRIFSGMKKGRMPYAGKERDEFVKIVGNYSHKFSQISDFYSSHFWEVAANPNNQKENRKMLIEVIKLFSKLSPKPLKENIEYEFPLNHFSFFNAKEKSITDYLIWLKQYIKPYSMNLEVVIFLGCLYREAMYSAKPELAFLLKLEYAAAAVNILKRFGVRHPLFVEFLLFLDQQMFGMHDYDLSTPSLQSELNLTFKSLNPVLKGLLRSHEKVMSFM